MAVEVSAAKGSGNASASPEAGILVANFAKLQISETGKRRLFHPAGTPFPSREQVRSRTFHFAELPIQPIVETPTQPDSKEPHFSDYSASEIAILIPGYKDIFYPERSKDSEISKSKSHPLADRLHKPFVALGRALFAVGSVFGAQHIATPGVNAGGFSVNPGMSEVYASYGGKDTWGSPISGVWIDDVGRKNQGFEKGIIQSKPADYAGGKVSVQVTFGNIYDEMHNKGKDPWLDAVRQTPPPADWSSDTGKSWPDVVQNHLAILPAEMRQYVEGTPDWINRYGLPVSIKDYGPWISVRFQRSNLQLLKEDFPYGKKGQILVANGGSVAKEAGGIIPDSVQTQESIPIPFISDQAKRLVVEYNIKPYAGITRWVNFPIPIWADPSFSRVDLERANSLWENVFSNKGVRFQIVTDRSLANIVFEFSNTLPGGVCGLESPTLIQNNIIKAGSGQYSRESRCTGSGTSASTALAHGLGHILGFAGHTPSDTDIMSAPNVPFRMSPVLQEAIQFIYAVTPSTQIQ